MSPPPSAQKASRGEDINTLEEVVEKTWDSNAITPGPYPVFRISCCIIAAFVSLQYLQHPDTLHYSCGDPVIPCALLTLRSMHLLSLRPLHLKVYL
jgi:hypothetical protein